MCELIKHLNILIFQFQIIYFQTFFIITIYKKKNTFSKFDMLVERLPLIRFQQTNFVCKRCCIDKLFAIEVIAN